MVLSVGWSVGQSSKYFEKCIVFQDDNDTKVLPILLYIIESPLIKQKPFIPKNDLPRLDDYSVDPPESYTKRGEIKNKKTRLYF